jgi:hypothetical protein
LAAGGVVGVTGTAGGDVPISAKGSIAGVCASAFPPVGTLEFGSANSSVPTVRGTMGEKGWSPEPVAADFDSGAGWESEAKVFCPLAALGVGSGKSTAEVGADESGDAA